MSIQKKQLNVIFYIPEVSRYRDRIMLWNMLAGNIGRMVLMVPEYVSLEDKKMYAHIDFCHPESPLNGFYAKLRWIKYSVNHLLKNGTYHAVMDTFGHLVLCQGFKKKYPHIIWLTSLFLLPKWDFKHTIWPMYTFKIFWYRSLRFSFLRMFLENQILKLSDALVLQSEYLEARIKEVYPKFHKPVWTIYNSFSIKDKVSAPDKSDSVLKFLVVGSISILKGIDRIFDFLNFLKRQNVKFQCTVIGDMLDFDTCFVQSHLKQFEKNEIIMHCKVPFKELETYYLAADYLIHLSRIEGSARVVGEALSFGLPCIVCDHPGVRIFEKVNHALVYADLEHGKTWNRILAHQKKCDHNMRLSIKTEMENLFSPERVVSMWENVLLNVTGPIE